MPHTKIQSLKKKSTTSNIAMKHDGRKRVNCCQKFIINSYRMIDTCHQRYPSIAQWSEDGESFVIKDPDEISTKIMSVFFRHNKFSSFVRQLNFYGFRKVRKNEIFTNLSAKDTESKYWRFQHTYFLCGRPDLLNKINHPRRCVAPVQEEIKVLKNEVSTMTKELSGMSAGIKDIKRTMYEMIDVLDKINDKRYRTYEETEGISRDQKMNKLEVWQPCDLSTEPRFLNMPYCTASTTSSLECPYLAAKNEADNFDSALCELGPILPDTLVSGTHNGSFTIDNELSEVSTHGQLGYKPLSTIPMKITVDVEKINLDEQSRLKNWQKQSCLKVARTNRRSFQKQSMYSTAA